MLGAIENRSYKAACLSLEHHAALQLVKPKRLKNLLCGQNCIFPLGSDSHAGKSMSQERKISPKRKFWGRISRGHPGVIRAGYPGPKLRSGRSKPWKNKHLGADIHDPKARTSTTLRDFQKLRSEKLWAEFSFPNVFPGKTRGHVRVHPFVNLVF